MSWQSDLAELIVNKFTIPDFERALGRIDRRVDTYAGPGSSLPDIAQRVVRGAENEGWTRDLVKTLLWVRPEFFRVFRETYGQISPTALKDTEARDLRLGLESAFRTYGELAAMLDGAPSVPTLDNIMGPGMVDPPSDYVARAIAWFDARGAVRLLVELALRTHACDPVLGANAERVLAELNKHEAIAGYREVNPADVCLINEHVFVDRDILRTAVKAWFPSPPTPIHAVNGPPRSGKTYSLQLVDFVASTQGSAEVAKIDIREEQPALYKPDVLAREILLLMNQSKELPNMPTMAPDPASAARRGKELAEWIAGIAKGSGKVWIIALDGFRHEDLPSETRDMVQLLVKQATRPGSPLRIILLDYSDDLLPVDTRLWVKTETLGGVTRDDLRAFFLRLAEQQGASVEGPDLEIIIDGITSQAPLNNMELLALQIQQWYDGLKSQPESIGVVQ